MTVQRLYCFMNDPPLGELTRNNGRPSFQYDPRWLQSPRGQALSASLPPRSLTNTLTLTPPEFDRQVGEVIQRGTHEALAKYQRLAGKG